jgi:hypothetical protein
MVPERSKRMARELVVPWSRARMAEVMRGIMHIRIGNGTLNTDYRTSSP